MNHQIKLHRHNCKVYNQIVGETKQFQLKSDMSNDLIEFSLWFEDLLVSGGMNHFISITILVT